VIFALKSIYLKSNVCHFGLYLPQKQPIYTEIKACTVHKASRKKGSEESGLDITDKRGVLW